MGIMAILAKIHHISPILGQNKTKLSLNLANISSAKVFFVGQNIEPVRRGGAENWTYYNNIPLYVSFLGAYKVDFYWIILIDSVDCGGIYKLPLLDTKKELCSGFSPASVIRASFIIRIYVFFQLNNHVLPNQWLEEGVKKHHRKFLLQSLSFKLESKEK